MIETADRRALSKLLPHLLVRDRDAVRQGQRHKSQPLRIVGKHFRNSIISNSMAWMFKAKPQFKLFREIASFGGISLGRLRGDFSLRKCAPHTMESCNSPSCVK